MTIQCKLPPVSHPSLENSMRLIYQEGNPNKPLTQDARSVCKLLAINPEDILPKELAAFESPMISEQRQQLKFDYFLEKKALKLKAIENILVKCQQAKNGSLNEEARHMLALLEDVKNISPTKKAKFTSLSTDFNSRSKTVGWFIPTS